MTVTSMTVNGTSVDEYISADMSKLVSDLASRSSRQPTYTIYKQIQFFHSVELAQ